MAYIPSPYLAALLKVRCAGCGSFRVERVPETLATAISLVCGSCRGETRFIPGPQSELPADAVQRNQLPLKLEH